MLCPANMLGYLCAIHFDTRVLPSSLHLSLHLPLRLHLLVIDSPAIKGRAMQISPVPRTFKFAAGSLMLVALLLVLPQPAAAKTCDRDCLRGFITRYLNAIVAHIRLPCH